MDMNNNDILIRLRYALDLTDGEMVKIFKLADVELTEEGLQDLLVKSRDGYNEDGDMFDDYTECSNYMLESFLNGLIIYKRGRQDPNQRKPDQPDMVIKHNRDVNNVLLKKVKIALALTSEDMMDILKSAGVTVTKSELSALLRKEGHKNYKQCGNRYARNFLKGLATQYRG